MSVWADKRNLFWAGAVVVAVAATLFLMPGRAKGNDTFAEQPPAQASANDNLNSVAAVEALGTAFANVVDNASPAVVYITIEKKPAQMPAGFYDGDEPNNFFGFPLPPMFKVPRGYRFDAPMRVGEGSGFIISSDGYILTNNHVANDADRLTVKLTDGREFQAELVGTDPQTEVALIKIDARDLPVAKLGDSDRLRVGEWVLAIGSPFGLSHTVTSGIVSARGRGDVRIVDGDFYSDFIQTDAAINPGNSGGPLLNIHGEVVGMNTAIVSRGGGNDGVGFAIPINMVKYVADQLKNNGTVTRGFLGIVIQPLTPELAKYFDSKESSGILVAEVAPDSPAAEAGLQQDDVIVELNGKAVGDTGAFRTQIAMTPKGKNVELTIARNGERITKSVSVGEKTSEEMAAASPRTSGKQQSQGKLGIGIQPLTGDLAKQFGYEGKTGLLVTEVVPGSPAMRAGIRSGDLITEVNRKPVADLGQFQDALGEGKNGTTLLRVQGEGGSRYVAIEVE
ncbi:MAG: DegQ family serine endoprotease [Candidatus Hydrogenedentes bacterium]|nr:DegQ family serine endoprotease [Candidatus Hydrogenedentota bacterium]